MKSKFFYGALAVLSLTACSQEEVLDVNRSGDEITFNVVTNKATRAADIYSNTVWPNSIKVWGMMNDDGTQYFAENIVSIDESTGACTYTDVRYWPNDRALDFFAIAGCSRSLHVTRAEGESNTKAEFTYFVVGDTKDENQKTVADQEDVLYAAAINKSKADENLADPVTLNFEHALSQIVFRAKVSNPGLHVVVSGVKVANLRYEGKFTFSQATDTDDKWDETEDGNTDTGAGYEPGNPNSKGGWEDQEGLKTYEITRSGEALTLTSSPQYIVSNEEKDAMILMPQNKEKYSSGNKEGAFFAVKCRIWNVANKEGFQKDTDICLWGEEGPAYVYIPADIEWTPGKKYIYTFDFGNGNGGFEPEPDPEDPDNPNPDPTDPVLIPIEYTVTVDDFDIVGQNSNTTVNGKD